MEHQPKPHQDQQSLFSQLSHMEGKVKSRINEPTNSKESKWKTNKSSHQSSNIAIDFILLWMSGNWIQV